MAADVITLQEVQKDTFDEWFRPELANAGYEGIYQQKKREPIFHRGKYTAEGCATFYKTTRFKRVDKHVIDYDKLSGQELRNPANPQEPDKVDMGLQRLSKGNIALAVILEDLHMKTTHGSQTAGTSGGHILCVVNTHILADPGSADVKFFQAHLMLNTIERMPSMPLLICGDFNSTPESAVYEYLRQGTVRSDHEDLRTDPCDLVKNLNIGHSLNMATAYETCNGQEAQYTNYTEDFKGTLDYIWFTSERLTVLAISQVDEESQLTQETALPSSTRPSDHVSLVATFMYRDVPADAQSYTQGDVGSQALPGSSQQSASGAGGPNPYNAGGAGSLMNNPSTTPNAEGFFMGAHWAAATSHGYPSRSPYGSSWS